MDAIYGEEVRGSIYNALVAMNAESTSAMEFASTAKDSARASATSAASSASTATEKATAASNSASAAAASEERTRTSEENAAAKAIEAGNYASAASQSEQNAASYKDVASQKAQEADDSKSAAAQSAVLAAASERAARTLREGIETYAEITQADKEAADAFKEAAEAARDAAIISEGKAKESEDSAVAAKDIAAQAKTDAEAAKTAALAAQQAAEDAKQDAEAAKENAELSAGVASDSATAAAESASSARQYSGNPARPDSTTKTWWIWNAATQQYEDTHIGSEIEGPRGVGISDIRLTSGDHSPGTSDIYTVEMTDGSTYNISVWNGRNGEGAGDVLGKSFDLVIPASGWSNGQITIADNRLIALSTHKYFISADEASCEEFLDCRVQPKDITTDGFITFTNETDPTNDLTVSVIRFELSANG